MGKIKDWIEAHPYLVGAFVLGIVVLYLIYRNSASSSAASSTTTAAPDTTAAQTEADQTALASQANQLGYNAQIASLNAGQTVSLQQTAANTQLAQLAAQVQLQQAVSGQEVNDNSTAAALQLGLANLGVTSSQYFSSNGTANSTNLTYNGNTNNVSGSPSNNTVDTTTNPTTVSQATVNAENLVASQAQQTLQDQIAKQNIPQGAIIDTSNYVFDVGANNIPGIVGYTPTSIMPTGQTINGINEYQTVAAGTPGSAPETGLHGENLAWGLQTLNSL
jgi:hypothetical protein